MACWNPKRDPEPEKRDQLRFKDFLRHKYVEKRFSADSHLSDSSDEKPKKKKDKKEKKKKKISSDSDEIVLPEKPQVQPVSQRKLGAPPGMKI